MLILDAAEMVTGWRPQDVLFALALIIIGGKQLWPYIFRTRVERARKDLATAEVRAKMDSETSDVTRNAEEMRAAVTAKDEQGRYRIHGWGTQEAINKQSITTATALSDVARSLSDLAGKIHKQSNVQQNTNGIIDRIDTKLDRLEGHITGQISERRIT